MRMKAIAALVLPVLLASVTVVLAQQTPTLIFQYAGELQCPGIEHCDVDSVYSGDLPIYEQYPYPAEGPTTRCMCDYYMYTDDPDPAADAIGVDYEFFAAEDVCVGVDVHMPTHSLILMGIPCGVGEEYLIGEKCCAGDTDLCTWWCGGTCDGSCSFQPYHVMSPTAVVIQISNAGQITESVDITVSVFALLNTPSPTPTPQVIPQLNPEYFNPFPYNRDVPSPLSGVRIDFTFVARSIVTVIGMISDGGYLTWIAAFAVIFMILLAFINYILKRISGEGG